MGNAGNWNGGRNDAEDDPLDGAGDEEKELDGTEEEEEEEEEAEAEAADADEEKVKGAVVVAGKEKLWDEVEVAVALLPSFLSSFSLPPSMVRVEEPEALLGGPSPSSVLRLRLKAVDVVVRTEGSKVEVKGARKEAVEEVEGEEEEREGE